MNDVTCRPREEARRGNLRSDRVRSGKVRGAHGLFQRRVRTPVFGEPNFWEELVSSDLEPTRPHCIAYDAWKRMVSAAAHASLNTKLLAIHSAYRPVSLQVQIWEYRLAERAQKRKEAGLSPLSRQALERAQRKWTAKPGQSAHHTGFALDFALYTLGNRVARRTPEFAWLTQHARTYGFYPYLPEAWHWEYNPPGLLDQLKTLRQCMAEGQAYAHLLRAPHAIPIAKPSS